MAATKNPVKLVTVAGRVTEGQRAALEDLHWKTRRPLGIVVGDAVTEYLAAHKVKVTEPEIAVSDEAPAEDSAPQA